jgi:hypothetical protein
MPNPKKIIYIFVTLGSTITWECSFFIFKIFETIVKETEMNRTRKISLIRIFVLFPKIIVNNEYDF